MWEQLKMLQHKEVIESIITKETKPIHVEIEPTEICNHGCTFCHWHSIDKEDGLLPNFDFDKRKLPRDRALKLIDEFEEIGVKAVSFTGAGDPMVYRHMEEVLERLHKGPIEYGMTTNLNMKINDNVIELLGYAKWVRISLNAGTKKGYDEIHHPRGNRDFEDTLENLERLVKSPKRVAPINISYVVCEGNIHEIPDIAEVGKKYGVDSISFRPETGLERVEGGTLYSEKTLKEFEKIEDMSDDKFKIYFNHSRQDETKIPIDDVNCHYSNFSVYIAANGDVYPCCMTRYEKGYAFGNILEKSFSEFWNSDERKENYKKINMTYCPPCRHGEDNHTMQKLYQIEKPEEFAKKQLASVKHVDNFI